MSLSSYIFIADMTLQLLSNQDFEKILYSKPIYIWWIRTGSHPYEKTMSSIVLYPVFYEYKNVQS